jgi:hypothetical protein
MGDARGHGIRWLASWEECDADDHVGGANPKSDSPDTGSFYNKAPRFSVFQGDSYGCEAIK